MSLPTKKLEEIEPENDTGAETAERFEYQYSYAALLALDFLKHNNDRDYLVMEHYDDIYAQLKDGSVVLFQVKTRRGELGYFKPSDKEILKTFEHFMRIERAHGTQIKRFCIALSQPHEKTAFETLKRNAQKNETLPKKIEQELSLKSSDNLEIFNRMFLKLEIDPNRPIETISESINKNLENFLPIIAPKVPFTRISLARENLVAACRKRSIKDSFKDSVLNYVLQNDVASARREAHINQRMLTREDVFDIIKESLRTTSWSQFRDKYNIEIQDACVPVLQIVAAIMDPFDSANLHALLSEYMETMCKITIKKPASTDWMKSYLGDILTGKKEKLDLGLAKLELILKDIIALDYLDVYILVEEAIPTLKISSRNELLPPPESITPFIDRMKILLEIVAHGRRAYKAWISNKLESKISSAELIEFSKNLLVTSDFSSMFDERYDESKYEPDTGLDDAFDSFLATIAEPGIFQRIFLLLGHMGLGKTWSLARLALKVVDKIPVFFFKLGVSYERDFAQYFGPFEEPKKTFFQQNSVLLIFDGFDEMDDDDRETFINNLVKFLKLLGDDHKTGVVLTSRLVDWVNTPCIVKHAGLYGNHIFSNDEYNEYQGIDIRTSASYILSEITDFDRLVRMANRYGLTIPSGLDNRVIKLLQKPFVLRLLAKQPNLLSQPFSANQWFSLFAGNEIDNVKSVKNKDTILHRMSIYGETLQILQDLVSTYPRPYALMSNVNLEPFKQRSPRAWSTIFSSGLIVKSNQGYQSVYSFRDEYAEFIDEYIGRLMDEFHGVKMCKADKLALDAIEAEINIKLEDYSDEPPSTKKNGFCCSGSRVVGLFLREKPEITHIPQGVLKLIGLQEINLSNINMWKIPDEFGQLRNLEKIDVSRNKLSSLPLSFKQLKNLLELNVSYNQFKTIPEIVKNLHCLQRLDIRGNKVVSLLEWLKDLKNLRFLSINHQEGQPYPLEYVASGLLQIDDQAIFQGQSSNFIQLRVKDTTVLDYLIRLKDNAYSHQEIRDGQVIKLQINTSAPLKPLFWSLEALETLTYFVNDPKFFSNSSIKKLHLTAVKDDKKDGSKVEPAKLTLDASIQSLSALEVLYIQGYDALSIPSNDILDGCPSLKHVYIDTPALTELPAWLLQSARFPNVMIDDRIPTEFGLLWFGADHGDARQFIIRQHVNARFRDVGSVGSDLNSLFIHVNNMSHISLQLSDSIDRIGIFPDSYITREDLEEFGFWKSTVKKSVLICGPGNPNSLPFIEKGSWKGKYLFIFGTEVRGLPDWILASPSITDVLITNPQNNIPYAKSQEGRITQLLEKKGLAEICVNQSCGLPEQVFVHDQYSRVRIRLPGLQHLPQSIRNLKRITRAFISASDNRWCPLDPQEVAGDDCLLLRIGNNLDESVAHFYQIENVRRLYLAYVKVPTINDGIVTKVEYVKMILPQVADISCFLNKSPGITRLSLHSGVEDPYVKTLYEEGNEGTSAGVCEVFFNPPEAMKIKEPFRYVTSLIIQGNVQIALGIKNLKLPSLSSVEVDGLDDVQLSQLLNTLDFTKLQKFYLRRYSQTTLQDKLKPLAQFKKMILVDKRTVPSLNGLSLEGCLVIEVAKSFTLGAVFNTWTDLTHLWVEVETLTINTPSPRKEMQVYQDKDPKMTLEEYLREPDPPFICKAKLNAAMHSLPTGVRIM